MASVFPLEIVEIASKPLKAKSQELTDSTVVIIIKLYNQLEANKSNWKLDLPQSKKPLHDN